MSYEFEVPCPLDPRKPCPSNCPNYEKGRQVIVTIAKQLPERVGEDITPAMAVELLRKHTELNLYLATTLPQTIIDGCEKQRKTPPGASTKGPSSTS